MFSPFSYKYSWTWSSPPSQTHRYKKKVVNVTFLFSETMAPQQVFVKKLTVTDINHRLSFPSEKLEVLPSVVNERDPVEFQVRCGGDQLYIFHCIKRKNGSHLKPVIQRGWCNVVKDKGLQVGDFLEFYMEASDREHERERQTRYWIEVRRCICDYQDEMGTIWSWHRVL